MPAPHVYRWDLDKTYLRTEFDSLKDLAPVTMVCPITGAAWSSRPVG